MPAVQQKIRSGVVELRTNVGLLYVSPSFWERVYLLWTFRNFHRLPQQVLNRHQRQLIEKLCRTAIVAGKGAIAKSFLIGAVENIYVAPDFKTEAAANTGKVFRMSASDVGAVQSRAVGSELISSGGNRRAKIRSAFPGQSGSVQFISASKSDSAQQTQTKRASQIPELSVAARTWDRNRLRRLVVAACSVVLLAMLFYFRDGRFAPRKMVPQVAIKAQHTSLGSISPTGAPQAENITQSIHVEHANRATTIALQPISPAGSSKQAESGQSQKMMLPKAPAATMDSTPLERLHVAESPQSGFSFPITPNAALTGIVTLKAVIGTDGTVTSVDVLSGNPALASAAVQAVRHWRYASHEISGKAVEAEINIVISFLGDEAVSINFPTVK
jgi:TonB family protein